MATSSAETPRPHIATFADLIAIPEAQRWHEILDGVLIPILMSGPQHGTTHARVISWAGPVFDRQQNGPSRPGGGWILADCDIELSPHQVVRPDVAGWRRERMPNRPTEHPVTLRPDWVCEIMTDGDARRRDGLLKRRIYADHGIPHYWLIDTEREELTVLRLTPRGYIDVLIAPRAQHVHPEPFAALELPVGVLFGDDPA